MSIPFPQPLDPNARVGREGRCDAHPHRPATHWTGPTVRLLCAECTADQLKAAQVARLRVIKTTGYADNFSPQQVLEQLVEEWSEFPLRLQDVRRWKYVNHLGLANLVPWGSPGRSLGTVTIKWEAA